MHVDERGPLGIGLGIAKRLGGFLGATLRYALSGWIQQRWPGHVPWGTMGVNVLGCFLLGALMVSRVPYAHFGTRFLQGRRDFSYLFVIIILIGLIMAWVFREEEAQRAAEMANSGMF